jgi:hypothetical protein
MINPLKAELNPIRYLLALLGAHLILHVSRIRVKTYLRTFLSVGVSRRGRLSSVRIATQYGLEVQGLEKMLE